MKHINESINDSIQEARQLPYRVQFNGPDGPVDATVMVDARDSKKFEAYLQEEIDNTILHASDPNGEPFES